MEGDYLTRAFFDEELDDLAQAYAKETGADKSAIELMLRNGVALKIEGRPVCNDRYITVDYKSGAQSRRAIIPYGMIIGVGFTAEQAEKRVGFHR